jgi:hypothetical protein
VERSEDLNIDAKFEAALDQVLLSEDLRPTAERFLFAFERKRVINGLDEGANIDRRGRMDPDAGLEFAVKAALSLHGRKQEVPSLPPIPVAITMEWRTRLQRATRGALTDHVAMELFAKSLKATGLDLGSILPDQLAQVLAFDFDLYAHRHELGWSGDPW